MKVSARLALSFAVIVACNVVAIILIYHQGWRSYLKPAVVSSTRATKIVSSASNAPATEGSDSLNAPSGNDLRLRLNALKAFESPYQPSLERRENAQFLLTPAILIQQSISGNTVITYPDE
jgi:hypothetical protein